MRFPLRVFSDKPSFPFMRWRYAGFFLSLALTVAIAVLMVTRGLNLGIDFTGGVVIEIQKAEPIDLGQLRPALSDPAFGEVSLQHFGTENNVMIRLQTTGDHEQSEIVALAKKSIEGALAGKVDYRKIDYVGPTVGEELITAGVMALLIAFAGMLLYIWFRFEWQFGVGGIIALIHDATLVVGFYLVTGYEFGLPAIAAVLTIVGYSINDSVVIYDRIRETMRRYKQKPMIEIIDESLNETLSRTVMTATTTLLTAVVLALYGGPVIEGFSWALAFGIAAGTYSSIFISAPVLLYLGVRADAFAAENPA